MCIPFFHKWSKWSAPVVVPVYPTDEVGNVVGPGWTKVRQTRACERCGKHQKRLV